PPRHYRHGGGSQHDRRQAANGLTITVGLSGLPWPVRVIGHDSAGAGSTSGVLAGGGGRGGRPGWPTGALAVPGRRAARSSTARARRERRESPFHLPQQRGELHDQGSGDLHFYNVRGRNGHLNNGDSMTFPATLLIKA